MKGKFFFDTNIFVYLSLVSEKTQNKRKIVLKLLNDLDNSSIIISYQVLNEFYNVMIKNKIDDLLIQEKIKQILKYTTLKKISIQTIMKCWELRIKYNFSYYDTLIISSALENKCSLLYTEDLQNGQIIDNKLKIVNPFFE